MICIPKRYCGSQPPLWVLMTTLQLPSKALRATEVRSARGAALGRLLRPGTSDGDGLGFAEVALPDRAAVELNDHAVRGIDRAFVPAWSPDVSDPVHPGAGWFARFVLQVQIPAVLRDESRLAGEPLPAHLHATILPAQVHALRRCVGCRQRA